MKEKLLVILGPTATGKTDLALQLAKKFGGELVACDSRQVYKGLDIGTGKAPDNLKIKNLQLKIKKENGRWIVNGINIWMYDVVSLDVQYSVADYVKDATVVTDEISTRGKLPIVVGGTGLYIKALLEGLPNLSVPVDPKMRKELAPLSLEELKNRLKGLSPLRWDSLNLSDKQNPRRLIRQIELVSMYPYMNTSAIIKGISDKYKILKIGLTAPRQVLYEKVDERVWRWINDGIVDETKNLQKEGVNLNRFRQLGLEYGVLANYLERKIKTQDELVKIMQGKTHGYVRRQQTWFKNPSNGSGQIHWFDITDVNYMDKVENMVNTWYY